ncbi:hypothetical protein, partial [Salmonella enterica]|uniref:hypothetical protein n=1 Tax=Salmonella enterica TaxID=28901 RepID=UPI001E2D09DA
MVPAIVASRAQPADAIRTVYIQDSTPRYYVGEQITIRYLLADIISTRALGAGGEMYPTEPH